MSAKDSAEENTNTDQIKESRVISESELDALAKGSTDPAEDKTRHASGESHQSPDISLSSQNTLRYCDVEAESKTQDSSPDGSSSVENHEDAPTPQEQAEFKNSFYEKLSVTYQNLENTVASLQNPHSKSEESVSQSDVKVETSSKIIPDDSVQDNLTRPETLSLSNPVNSVDSGEKGHDKTSVIPKQMNKMSKTDPISIKKDHDNESSSNEEIPGAHFIDPSNLSPSVRQGIFVRKGGMIEYVADNLEEKIKKSSPLPRSDGTESPSSRRSSVRSIASASASSSPSFATSSGVSRSPSSLLQQSPDDIPPIDAGAISELEHHAQRVADSLDLMMGNMRNNLHKMSAITIGCQDAYKRSVDISCDSVDSSIKQMYALMAKCEELSQSMGPVEHLAAQIKEIKRILDLFELQLTDK